MTDDGGWQRLHPLTPVVRGWKVVVVLLAIIAQQRGDDLLRQGVPSRQEALISLAVLAAAVLLVGGYALLAWQRSRYRVDADSLQLQKGVLFRQERRARLDRLQAVDVVRPLLARFFGLAELKVEVAGGKDSAIHLSLLRENQARQLRNTLLARAAGLAYEGQDAPEAPEHVLLTVPVGRTVESLLRSMSTVIAVVMVVVGVVVAAVVREPGVLAGVVPVVLGAASALWARFTSAFGFRVATSPDGIRLQHGLLTTRAQTVPPGRVQAVRLGQPLLWRGRDWWRLQVNVAGYGGGAPDGEGQGDATQQENVLLSVGSRAEALLVLGLVLPALHGQDDGQRAAALAAGMTGTDASAGFVVAPRSARWLDWVTWRRHGVRVLDDVLLLRRGVLVRELDVVPHARTQSLGLQQGPVQRRLGLATFVVHSTRGPVAPTAAHLAAPAAAALLQAQAARARAARAGAGDLDQGRWMERP